MHGRTELGLYGYSYIFLGSAISLNVVHSVCHVRCNYPVVVILINS